MLDIMKNVEDEKEKFEADKTNLEKWNNDKEDPTLHLEHENNTLNGYINNTSEENKQVIVKNVKLWKEVEDLQKKLKVEQEVHEKLAKFYLRIIFFYE